MLNKKHANSVSRSDNAQFFPSHAVYATNIRPSQKQASLENKMQNVYRRHENRSGVRVLTYAAFGY